MSQKNFSKEIAGHLWEHMQVTTSKHRLCPKLHKASVLFVGYADFILSVGGIEVIALPGNSIKLMGDQIHFDPKQEKARDGSRYYPVWLPISTEARAVLTECLKVDPQIVEMCHKAVAQVTPVATVPGASPNPFMEG